jgi:hypothetical protein
VESWKIFGQIFILSHFGFVRLDLVKLKVFKLISLCNMNMRCHATCRPYTFLTKRKAFAKYRWCKYSQWQFTLIPAAISSKMTYKSVVSVPIEKHIYIYDIHHHLTPK